MDEASCRCVGYLHLWCHVITASGGINLAVMLDDAGVAA